MKNGHSHARFYESPEGEAAPGRLIRWAAILSVAVALSLTLLKAAAWSVTDSLSVLSSAVDSLLDVAASALNFLAIRYALVPPDREHRFGHGKAEDLAGLAQATFITGSGLFIFVEGIRRMIDPAPIVQETTGLWVMGVSMVLTSCLVAFQRYVVRKTGSAAIGADAFHYVTDLLTNAGIILALLLATKAGWALADPIIAFAIAGYILYGAWRIGYASFQRLMDREFPDEERKRIIALVKAEPGVLGLHALKTRQSGMYRFIQMHLAMDETLTLRQAHDIAESVEERLMKEFPMTDVIVHQDPVTSKK